MELEIKLSLNLQKANVLNGDVGRDPAWIFRCLLRSIWLTYREGGSTRSIVGNRVHAASIGLGKTLR